MLAPLSSDMQASDLKPFLANIFIADKFAPRLVQVGTAGAGIKNLVGDNPFGMLLSAQFSALSRAALATRVPHGILAILEITWMSLHSIVWDRHKRTARMLLLPMIDAQLHSPCPLGVLLPDRANAGTVTKFHIDTIRSYRSFVSIKTAAEASAQPDAIQQSDWINQRRHLTQAGQAQSMRPAYLNAVR